MSSENFCFVCAETLLTILIPYNAEIVLHKHLSDIVR